MKNLKLVNQLFIGKVADEIGMERTIELLKEAKEAFDIPVVVKQSELLKDDDFRCIQESSKTGRCKCLKEEDCEWAD